MCVLFDTSRQIGIHHFIDESSLLVLRSAFFVLAALFSLCTSSHVPNCLPVPVSVLVLQIIFALFVTPGSATRPLPHEGLKQ